MQEVWLSCKPCETMVKQEKSPGGATTSAYCWSSDSSHGLKGIVVKTVVLIPELEIGPEM